MMGIVYIRYVTIGENKNVVCDIFQGLEMEIVEKW